MWKGEFGMWIMESKKRILKEQSRIRIEKVEKGNTECE